MFDTAKQYRSHIAYALAFEMLACACLLASRQRHEMASLRLTSNCCSCMQVPDQVRGHRAEQGGLLGVFCRGPRVRLSAAAQGDSM